MVSADPMEYLVVFLITLGMVIVSKLFSKKFGLNMQQQMENQERLQNLQQELMKAQSDPMEMQRIQAESAELMSSMMKKQMLPMCLRSLLFFGIFGLLAAFYAGVEFDKNPIQIFGPGYASLYFMYSIGLSLVFWGIKKIIRAIKPELKEKDEKFVDHARLLKSHINVAPEPSYGNLEIDRTDKKHLELDSELKTLRNDLIAKKKNGELPADIDIDEEINRMKMEKLELLSREKAGGMGSQLGTIIEKDIKTKPKKKSWKQRLAESDEE
ncbi:MAG: DUF106 domain-containing protein [Candidatus Lokiarchaeota archaeon]|nr:DUF106 domain-containing protein [Candidatus Lokiarchaeota archaeon]